MNKIFFHSKINEGKHKKLRKFKTWKIWACQFHFVARMSTLSDDAILKTIYFTVK